MGGEGSSSVEVSKADGLTGVAVAIGMVGCTGSAVAVAAFAREAKVVPAGVLPQAVVAGMAGGASGADEAAELVLVDDGGTVAVEGTLPR